MSRTWGWHLKEMKEAASGSGQAIGPTGEASDTWQSVMSSFTPVNRQEISSAEQKPVTKGTGQAGKTSDSKSSKKQQGRKRKQTQVSEAKTTPSKSTKRSTRAKARSSSKHIDENNQDISQTLKITKPGIASYKSLPKADGELQSRSEPQLRVSNMIKEVGKMASDVSAKWAYATPVGLGQTYQAAYGHESSPKPTLTDHGVDLRSSVIVHESQGQIMLLEGPNEGVSCETPPDLPKESTNNKIQTEPVGDPVGDQTRPIESSIATDRDLFANLDATSRDAEAKLRERTRGDETNPPRFHGAVACAEFDSAQPYRNSSLPAGDSDFQHRIDYASDVVDLASETGQDILAGGVLLSLPAQDNDKYDNDDDFFHVDNFLSDDIFDEILDFVQTKDGRWAQATASETPKDPFEDDDLDVELMNINPTTPARTDGHSPPFTQRTPPQPKLQWMPPTVYTSPAKQLTTSSPTMNTTIQTSPATPLAKPSPLSERSPNTPAHVLPTKEGHPIPFARPPFPASTLPRSPIPGPSPLTLLRTCFRTGEALNAASLALRRSTDTVIELYCRVKYSDREANGYKQYFELADLFTPDKAPTLNGHYAIWKGVDLWDHDARQFLGERGRGKKARVIGRIKRGVKNVGWEIIILSVWQVDWEDVRVAKGMVCF